MGAQQSLPEDELPRGAKHQTRLQYRNTWRVDSANRLFGACYNGNTVVIINPGRSLVKPYIRVPEGTYALVQTQGRDVDWHGPNGKRSAVWPPGFHWATPFTKVAHLVTKQYIVFDTPVKGCKTADDVTVSIDMCLVLRIMGDEKKGEDPELVRRFVYELGPNGLEVQLRAAQDEAVRALARSVLHTEVYQLRDGTMKERFNTGALNFRTNVAEQSVTDELTTPKSLGDSNHGDGKGAVDAAGTPPIPAVPEAKVLYCVTEDIRRNLNAQFNTYGVEITSVAITDVKLPETFQEQMQSRTTHLSAIKEQNMKQMSDMQLLQYKEEIDMTKLKRRMMMMEEEQTGKAKCAEIQKEVDLIKADVKLVQEQILQETLVRVNNLNVEANLKIAQIRADTERIAKEISAHCDADIEMIKAETDALKLELNALVEELRVSGEAKAAEIVARAEGLSAKKLEKFRAHELSMKRLDMLASLSQNKQTVVSGDTSGSLLADMLVSNRQQSVLLNVDGKKEGTSAFNLIKS